MTGVELINKLLETPRLLYCNVVIQGIEGVTDYPWAEIEVKAGVNINIITLKEKGG